LRRSTFGASAPTLLQSALNKFIAYSIIKAPSAKGSFAHIDGLVSGAQIRATGCITWYSFETSRAGINIPAIVSNTHEKFKGLKQARNVLRVFR
jgi:hypothetical protein